MLVEAVTDYAIYMLNTEGIVSSWNPGARRFKGYEESEIIGEHFSRFYTDGGPGHWLAEKALETAEREGKFEAEGWRVRKDASRFWAYVIIDPIRRDPRHRRRACRLCQDHARHYRTQEAGRTAGAHAGSSYPVPEAGSDRPPHRRRRA